MLGKSAGISARIHPPWRDPERSLPREWRRQLCGLRWCGSRRRRDDSGGLQGPAAPAGDAVLVPVGIAIAAGRTSPGSGRGQEFLPAKSQNFRAQFRIAGDAGEVFRERRGRKKRDEIKREVASDPVQGIAGLEMARGAEKITATDSRVARSGTPDDHGKLG